MYHIFLDSVMEHLIALLGNINNATINIRENAFFFQIMFLFFSDIPRSRIEGSVLVFFLTLYEHSGWPCEFLVNVQ